MNGEIAGDEAASLASARARHFHGRMRMIAMVAALTAGFLLWLFLLAFAADAAQGPVEIDAAGDVPVSETIRDNSLQSRIRQRAIENRGQRHAAIRQTVTTPHAVPIEPADRRILLVVMSIILAAMAAIAGLLWRYLHRAYASRARRVL